MTIATAFMKNLTHEIVLELLYDLGFRIVTTDSKICVLEQNQKENDKILNLMLVSVPTDRRSKLYSRQLIDTITTVSKYFGRDPLYLMTNLLASYSDEDIVVKGFILEHGSSEELSGRKNFFITIYDVVNDENVSLWLPEGEYIKAVACYKIQRPVIIKLGSGGLTVTPIKEN